MHDPQHRDGLEEQHVSVVKIRNAVRFVRSSPARETKFRECVEREKIAYTKKVCLDVETRWNSTYLMLETAEKYVDAFERLQSLDYNYKEYFQADFDDEESNARKRKRKKERNLGPPTKSDWARARNFMKYLKIFYDVTNLISGNKYVTSKLFFKELVAMRAGISKMCLSSDKEEREMAISMRTKYDKYWDNIDKFNLLLYVAVVLDPRDKMRYLDFCLGQTYGAGSPKSKEVSERVRSVLNELFDHYKMKVDKVNGKTSSSLGCAVSEDKTGDMKTDLESSYLKFLEGEGNIEKSEVEVYLSDGMEKRDEKFDILNWWKMNSVKFPILSQIDRHVLAMPISTVASESAFSIGGRVIDPFRSSLSPQTAESLICAQDWIRSSPTDIELSDAKPKSKDIGDLQEKLEKLEIDAFSSGSKFFTMQDSCL
ncbi:PREDICTED: zinc finger BED domain-containing protein RICESLEEPER 2-like [Erythranthe guttata]|uniref:zinc finger BED domain-containing protein RICESLEEPER 2-like n=1 Tax=Erythranthe guttata TaxID=4155 RepID=UPI00064DD516|nr:PREDICTED: zinc finger BED domain-containing protein RICESLEEPER 2-like [Erythranthe guttata]|eukprot:XP_012833299.1 PREDICTED: zinc finger BED domain-containing protein RICESLEEPER 2-like [Erythranthe guttata]